MPESFAKYFTQKEDKKSKPLEEDFKKRGLYHWQKK